MTPDGIIRHVRSHPRWYTAIVTWLVMMIVLPVVGADIIPAFAAPAAQQQTPSTVAAVAPTAPAPTAAPITASTPPAPTVAEVAAPPSIEPPTLTESEPPEIIPPEQLPPGFFDPFFDAVPGLPVVDTPEELMPVLRAVAPIANYGCSATGLASLVLAVVAPTVDGVPLERIIPYLAPVTTACANFPIPKTHTECELDQPFIIDIGGLAKSPPVIGVGIDVIAQMEAELIAAYGAEVPRISESLRESLNCEIVTT